MSMPNMISVVSSNVESVGYDKENQTVYVKFLGGSTYTYKEVPKHVFEALRDAPSVGSYLNVHYKNVYAYERID